MVKHLVFYMYKTYKYLIKILTLQSSRKWLILSISDSYIALQSHFLHNCCRPQFWSNADAASFVSTFLKNLGYFTESNKV